MPRSMDFSRKNALFFQRVLLRYNLRMIWLSLFLTLQAQTKVSQPAESTEIIFAKKQVFHISGPSSLLKLKFKVPNKKFIPMGGFKKENQTPLEIIFLSSHDLQFQIPEIRKGNTKKIAGLVGQFVEKDFEIWIPVIFLSKLKEVRPVQAEIRYQLCDQQTCSATLLQPIEFSIRNF